MLKRKVESLLFEYYKSDDKMIPIVVGARQIGKSFIIRETAKKTFSFYAEIDLKSDYEGDQLFASVKTTKDFYLAISSIKGDLLHNYNDTIVFLDEIQFYPHLITLLKDLKKEKKYRYIASGSLLGITLKHIFIPMGSIQEIKMYPLDFEEFLWANSVGTDVIDYLKNCFVNLSPISDGLHNRMLSLFKDYLICGGLPDSVTEYVINRNVFRMREIHTSIHSYYKDDCSKYDDEHNLKIKRIYDLLISNMQNKVKRIQFKKIEGIDDSNLEKYEDEFDYLISSGVVLAARAISNPIFPLNESISKNLIKIFYNDVGLLTNLLYKNNINAVLSNDININLGSVYETACLMELVAHGHCPYYFDSKKVGEVDFLINDYNSLSVIPVEIKSGKNQYNFRAIPKLVAKDGNYKLPFGYVFGNENIIKKDNNLIILPIYLIMFI